MDNSNNTTEQNIINAAVTIFTNHGFQGTSMQMIADKSGTNKALLHYYFRSKKQLFEKTFEIIINDFLKNIYPAFEHIEPLNTKIHHLVRSLILYGNANRDYINFLISELRRNSELINLIEKNLSIQFKKGLLSFYHQVNEAMENREIKQTNPRVLLEIIFNLCLTDVMTENFYKGLFGKNDSKQSQEKEIINFKTKFILQGIS